MQRCVREDLVEGAGDDGGLALQVAAVDDAEVALVRGGGVGGGRLGLVFGLGARDHGGGAVEAEDGVCARGDLSRQLAVPAAEVEDLVGWLRVEPSGDFGRELWDEGGGGGVGLVGKRCLVSEKALTVRK